MGNDTSSDDDNAPENPPPQPTPDYSYWTNDQTAPAETEATQDSGTDEATSGGSTGTDDPCAGPRDQNGPDCSSDTPSSDDEPTTADSGSDDSTTADSGSDDSTSSAPDETSEPEQSSAPGESSNSSSGASQGSAAPERSTPQAGGWKPVNCATFTVPPNWDIRCMTRKSRPDQAWCHLFMAQLGQCVGPKGGQGAPLPQHKVDAIKRKCRHLPKVQCRMMLGNALRVHRIKTMVRSLMKGQEMRKTGLIIGLVVFLVIVILIVILHYWHFRRTSKASRKAHSSKLSSRLGKSPKYGKSRSSTKKSKLSSKKSIKSRRKSGKGSHRRRTTRRLSNGSSRLSRRRKSGKTMKKSGKTTRK